MRTPALNPNIPFFFNGESCNLGRHGLVQKGQLIYLDQSEVVHIEDDRRYKRTDDEGAKKWLKAQAELAVKVEADKAKEPAKEPAKEQPEKPEKK